MTALPTACVRRCKHPWTQGATFSGVRLIVSRDGRRLCRISPLSASNTSIEKDAGARGVCPATSQRHTLWGGGWQLCRGYGTHMKRGLVWPILLERELWASCAKRVRDSESEVQA